jgi:hypothetical protein
MSHDWKDYSALPREGNQSSEIGVRSSEFGDQVERVVLNALVAAMRKRWNALSTTRCWQQSSSEKPIHLGQCKKVERVVTNAFAVSNRLRRSRSTHEQSPSEKSASKVERVVTNALL